MGIVESEWDLIFLNFLVNKCSGVSMVKIEFIYWVIFSIIEAISVVYCYKKISRVNKVNIHFTLLCLGIVFLTDFTTIIHYSDI